MRCSAFFSAYVSAFSEKVLCLYLNLHALPFLNTSKYFVSFYANKKTQLCYLKYFWNMKILGSISSY